MNIIICIEKIGRYIEGEFVREFRIRISRTWVNKRILFRTKEFGEGNKKLVKVAELKRMEQRGEMIEKFVQEFKRATRDSKYEKKALIKKFKRGMNRVIRKKLIEIEKPPTSIKQWYK